MDKESADKLTRDILAKSKLELTNNDFSNLLMDKIRNKKRKQAIIYNIVLYFLIFISLDAILFVALKLMNIRITEIALKINSFSHGTLITKYFLFIYFMVFAFLAFKVLSRTQHGYSRQKG